jgi:flavin reductase (DIM6/NTAB) family NADH-FMN oxidoreductase RutF
LYCKKEGATFFLTETQEPQNLAIMRTIDTHNIPTPQLHQILVSTVAPRPIAFVSTLSEDGTSNLAPYSFFNVFSSNPPTAVFSSNRRVSDNTTKDTLANAEATGEVVINMVSYPIVRQMALASIDYPTEVSEFDKAGFTPVPSEVVKPFRVKEALVQMECKVKEIKPLGESGGAGNLVICEILRIHLDESIFDEKDRIDPHKLDLMGRMGRAFYCRASGDAIHHIYQPFQELGIGFDQLPPAIRHSKVLTGNQLAALAAVTELPSEDSIDAVRKDSRVMDALAGNAQDREAELHRYAAELVEAKEIEKAWQVLLA